jgi:hypothetical protein
MFMLRRSAVRALSAPSRTLLSSRPRSITSFTPAAFRSRQQHKILPALQRRFVSNETEDLTATDKAEVDEAVETEGLTAADKAEVDEAVEAASTGVAFDAQEFAQTATEAPVDDALEPVVEERTASDGADALGAAAGEAAQQFRRPAFQGEPATPNNTLYVGNLFFEVTEEQLQRVFSRFGTVQEVKIITDPRGRSRGFAIIKYENLADATAAVENLDMQVFEGRNMVVQYHKSRDTYRQRPVDTRPPSPPSKTLYIGNMSFQMTDKDLNDLFKSIRNVLDVRVAIDRRTGQPRGFAHADFVDVESATRAMEELNGKSIYGRQLRIDFSRTGNNTMQKTGVAEE